MLVVRNTMIIHLCPVIRGKDNQRALTQVARVDEIQQPSDLVVDIGGLRVIVVTPRWMVDSLRAKNAPLFFQRSLVFVRSLSW